MYLLMFVFAIRIGFASSKIHKAPQICFRILTALHSQRHTSLAPHMFTNYSVFTFDNTFGYGKVYITL